MKLSRLILPAAAVALWAAAAFGPASQAHAQALPPEVAIIAGAPGRTAAEIATQDVLALNTTMFELYGSVSQVFRRNILAKHPVILGMFSGAGGRLILYRPGQPPLDAPSVPIVYQMLKSVGHATMALSGMLVPYLNDSTDQSWRGPLQAFRSRMQSALDGLDATGMPDAWRAECRTLLQANLAFMDETLARRSVTLAALEAHSRKQAPHLKTIIAAAAHTQVAHWMTVVEEWKALLGAQWAQTYAASNTIYVTRQNNILFGVLAQYFGAEAINDRLLLIETISFTTTPDELLQSLVRIVGDRTIGAVFFGNYKLMDYELMGGDARDAIVAETRKRGMTTVLPPAVAFGSTQWPALVTPGSGPSSLADLP